MNRFEEATKTIRDSGAQSMTSIIEILTTPTFTIDERMKLADQINSVLNDLKNEVDHQKLRLMRDKSRK